MQRIGPYQIVRELGAGGAGTVYEVVAPAGQHVALKLVHTQPSANQRRRLEREAGAWTRLNHPGVVRLLGVGEDLGRPYLVMELVAAPSLERLLGEQGPFAPSRAARVIRDAARALGYVHGQGLLHRDLKPDNVLLDAGDRPRLTDFGLIKDVAAEQSRLTHTGALLGTPGYWPPEQAAGDLQRIGPAADVYALGATLYALLTGRPPLLRESIAATLEATVQEQAPLPSALRPEVPRALDAICARCLAKRPEERFPSAEALADALDAHLARVAAAPRSRLPLLNAAGLVIVGVGAALWIVLQRPAPGGSAPATSPPQSAVAPSPTPSVSTPDLPLPDVDLLQVLNRAATSLQQGFPEEALAAAEQALERDPANPDAHRLRGVALLRLGQVGRALGCFERVVELTPEAARAWQERAAVYGQLGRLAESAADLREALAREPHEPLVLVDLASSLRLLGQHAEAMACLDEAIAFHPGYAAAYVERSVFRRFDGDRQGALDDAEQAIALGAAGPRPYQIRAQARLDAGATQEALPDAQRAAELAPQEAGNWITLADVQARLVDFDGAEVSLTRALQLREDDASLWSQRGLVRIKQRAFTRALEDCERALALAPGDPEHHLRRAVALDGLGRPQEALAALDQALARGGPPSMRYERSVVLQRLGRLDESAADLELALQLEPSLYRARYDRAVRRALADDLRGALEDLDRVVVDAEAAGGLLTSHLLDRGNVRLRLGLPAEALADLERLLQAAPGEGAGWVLAAEAHLALGHTLDARAAAERALRLVPAGSEHRARAERALQAAR